METGSGFTSKDLVAMAQTRRADKSIDWYETCQDSCSASNIEQVSHFCAFRHPGQKRSKKGKNFQPAETHRLRIGILSLGYQKKSFIAAFHLLPGLIQSHLCCPEQRILRRLLPSLYGIT